MTVVDPVDVNVEDAESEPVLVALDEPVLETVLV